jgi:hypothetical protein
MFVRGTRVSGLNLYPRKLAVNIKSMLIKGTGQPIVNHLNILAPWKNNKIFKLFKYV